MDETKQKCKQTPESVQYALKITAAHSSLISHGDVPSYGILIY